MIEKPKLRDYIDRLVVEKIYGTDQFKVHFECEVPDGFVRLAGGKANVMDVMFENVQDFQVRGIGNHGAAVSAKVIAGRDIVRLLMDLEG